jgi:hypothetical protein
MIAKTRLFMLATLIASQRLTSYQDSSMCRKVIVSITETVQSSASACFSIEILLIIIPAVTIPMMELS